MLAIVPWAGAGIEKSPFVKVIEIMNIPGAAGIMNFVVLVAELSAMNSQLYITTRMMFSLSKAGYAPARIGKLNKKTSLYSLNGYTCEVQNGKSQNKSYSKSHKLDSIIHSIFHSQKGLEMQISLSL